MFREIVQCFLSAQILDRNFSHNLVMKHIPGADPELVLLNHYYEELDVRLSFVLFCPFILLYIHLMTRVLSKITECIYSHTRCCELQWNSYNGLYIWPHGAVVCNKFIMEKFVFKIILILNKSVQSVLLCMILFNIIKVCRSTRASSCIRKAPAHKIWLTAAVK